MVHALRNLDESLSFAERPQDNVQVIRGSFCPRAILRRPAGQERFPVLLGPSVHKVPVAPVLFQQRGGMGDNDFYPLSFQPPNPPLGIGFLVEILVANRQVDPVQVNLLESLHPRQREHKRNRRHEVVPTGKLNRVLNRISHACRELFNPLDHVDRDLAGTKELKVIRITRIRHRFHQVHLEPPVAPASAVGVGLVHAPQLKLRVIPRNEVQRVRGEADNGDLFALGGNFYSGEIPVRDNYVRARRS